MRLRGDSRIFLERWGWECRWFGVFVHRMDAPDPGRALHDHAWRFWSLVLKGGYTEERADIRTPDRVYVAIRRSLTCKGMRLDECHRIYKLHRTPTWTLVLRGPKVRPWGFHTRDGWVPWRVYEGRGEREL